MQHGTHRIAARTASWRLPIRPGRLEETGLTTGSQEGHSLVPSWPHSARSPHIRAVVLKVGRKGSVSMYVTGFNVYLLLSQTSRLRLSSISCGNVRYAADR